LATQSCKVAPRKNLPVRLYFQSDDVTIRPWIERAIQSAWVLSKRKANENELKDAAETTQCEDLEGL
jgi:hypothetical protein